MPEREREVRITDWQVDPGMLKDIVEAPFYHAAPLQTL